MAAHLVAERFENRFFLLWLGFWLSRRASEFHCRYLTSHIPDTFFPSCPFSRSPALRQALLLTSVRIWGIIAQGQKTHTETYDPTAVPRARRFRSSRKHTDGPPGIHDSDRRKTSPQIRCDRHGEGSLLHRKRWRQSWPEYRGPRTS